MARDCPNAHGHQLRAADGALVLHNHDPAADVAPAAALQRNMQKRSAYICAFKMTIAEIDRAIARLDGAVVADDEGAEKEVWIKALVPEEYYEFLPLFTEAV